jgi:protein-arginine kinase activator protein McsA
MAMPQRGDPPSRCELRRTSTIEAIVRIGALLEYAVMHGDYEEAERIREKLRKLTESV